MKTTVASAQRSELLREQCSPRAAQHSAWALCRTSLSAKGLLANCYLCRRFKIPSTLHEYTARLRWAACGQYLLAILFLRNWGQSRGGESETLQFCRQGALRHPRGRIERSARTNFQSVPRVAVSAIWLRFRLTLRHLDAVLTHRQNYLGKRGRRKPGRGTKATFQPCLA